MLVIRARIHKMLVRMTNREDSDLGLPCLSRPFFWQATSVRYFRAFTVVYKLFCMTRVNPYKPCALFVGHHNANSADPDQRP